MAGFSTRRDCDRRELKCLILHGTRFWRYEASKNGSVDLKTNKRWEDSGPNEMAGFTDYDVLLD